MPATNAGAATELDALAGSITHISAHTAAPGDAGANEVAGAPYARQTVAFNAAATKNLDSSSVPDIPIAGGVTVTHVGLWTAVTGGTMQYWVALPASQTDAADWVLQVTDLDISLTP